MTRIALIAAVARNGVIGGGNQMLWRLPQDQRFLREQTSGCPVVMGRKTWDSLPERFRPLPHRHNIVVTRQIGWHAEGATVAGDLATALQLAAARVASVTAPAVASATAPMATASAAPPTRIWVLGGAELYAAALPLADELVLTEIDADFAGDAHFPAWPREQFIETRRERHHAAPPNDFDFSFVTYQRIA